MSKTSSNTPIRVLFVCTGNICRSPMAEAVFQHIVKEEGLADQFEIASSGTSGWHVGERPHSGTQNILKTYGVELAKNKRAQQLTRNDFETYDYIIAMDSINLSDMSHYSREVPRLLDFAPEGTPNDVPDPYYSGGFDYVYKLVEAGSRGLLNHIRAEKGI